MIYPMLVGYMCEVTLFIESSDRGVNGSLLFLRDSGFVQQGPSSGQQKASHLLLAQKPRHFLLPLMGDVRAIGELLANRSPEQNLIDLFVEALNQHENEEIKIKILHNKSCRSQTFADIEFTSASGMRWAIEVKSNDSKDAHNTAHKIFGELLKETGRENRDAC